MKFSLAMSSMPLLRERERTRTNHRGTERNEKTRQREEGGSVRVVGGAVMRVWGGGVGSASGRAGSSARRVARDGSARGDRGRSIVGSIAVDRDGSFPPRRSTLARRSSRDASGREGAGAIDAGAGRGRGARATTHIWRSFSFCTRAYTSGSASLRGLRASGKTASCAGRGRAGWGGGFGGGGRRSAATNDVSRDRARAVVTSVGGGPRSRRARPRRGASIEARARRRGRLARAMTHHGVLRGRVASRGARRGSARRSRSDEARNPSRVRSFSAFPAPEGRKKRDGRSWPWSVR